MCVKAWWRLSQSLKLWSAFLPRQVNHNSLDTTCLSWLSKAANLLEAHLKGARNKAAVNELQKNNARLLISPVLSKLVSFFHFQETPEQEISKAFSSVKLLGLSIGVQAAIWNIKDKVQVRDCTFKVTYKRMNCGVLNLPPGVKAIKVRTVLPSCSWFRYQNVLLHSWKKSPLPLLILGKQISLQSHQ